MVVSYQVVWDKPALAQLKQAYEYIRLDSVKNAIKVRDEILARAASLFQHPLRFPSDKLRLDNNPDFRAFELHRYRVSYYIDKPNSKVVVLRVRHTSQEPLVY